MDSSLSPSKSKKWKLEPSDGKKRKLEPSDGKKRKLEPSDDLRQENEKGNIYDSICSQKISRNTVEGSAERDIGFLKLLLTKTKPSRKSYKSELKLLDWDELASEADFESAEGCEERFEKLIKKQTKIKCMHQIVQETLEDLPRKLSGRNNAFIGFMSAHKEAIDQKMEEQNLDRFGAASILWKTMSDIEKNNYGIQSKAATSPTGFQMYLRKLNGDKDLRISKDEAFEKWNNLKDKKKFKYIKKSIELMKKADEFKASEHWDKHGKQRRPGPNKDEVDFVFEYRKLPVTPYNSPEMMYFYTVCSDVKGKSILFQAKKLFNQLSKEEKDIWEKRCKKAWKLFKSELDDWKANQEECTIYLFDRIYGKKINDSVYRKLRGYNKEKVAGIIKLSLNYEKVSYSAPKFSGEPAVPPLTPILLYSAGLQNTNHKTVNKEIRQKYFALTRSVRTVYEAKSKQINEEYKKSVLAYVSQLKSDACRIYLGMKRVRFINIFSEDIFEEYWPNKIYPAFIHNLKDGGRKVFSESEIINPNNDNCFPTGNETAHESSNQMQLEQLDENEASSSDNEEEEASTNHWENLIDFKREDSDPSDDD